jgi:hypothetical protein
MYGEDDEEINRSAHGLSQDVWRKPKPAEGTVEVESSDKPCEGKVGWSFDYS